MSPAAAALALALLGAGGGSPFVEVRVLTREHSTSAQVLGPSRHRLEIRSGRLAVDGVDLDRLALPPSRWTVRVPGGRPRSLEGALSVRAEAGELALVVAMPLEAYVAEAVAAETPAGTPPAALEAQAVVSRSFARAGPRRHPDADVCDLSHCQALALPASPEHRRAAREATAATRGMVLRLSSAAIARTPFHAACGGHTADPREQFGGDDPTGAAAVPDPGCEARWEATLSPAAFAAATARAFGQRVQASDLRLERGPGGFVSRALAPGAGRIAAGDALARALDRAVGWGQVRSSRLELEPLAGGGIRVRGSGLGHGVGLCQSGAARMARTGASAREILLRFFPRAHLALD